MTMVRHTKQRQAVIEVLKAARCHPDAAWIHSEVRKLQPTISLGTVYRTLDALVRDGVAVTIERAGCATCYDYRCDNHDHHHAVCRQCGAIFDIDAHLLPTLPLDAFLGAEQFQVTDIRVEFMGACPQCQAGPTADQPTADQHARAQPPAPRSQAKPGFPKKTLKKHGPKKRPKKRAEKQAIS